MKKRLLSGFLCLCMVLTLLPAGAWAAVPSGVTVDGTWIFANGNAITLKAGTSADKTLIYLDSDLSNPITLTGPEGNTTDGYDLSSYRIYGGCYNIQSPAATVETTSVTMEGGKVDLIHGGGHGASAAGAEPTSIVTGTASVTIKGGSVEVLYGGGDWGATTDSTSVTISGGTVGACYAGHNSSGKVLDSMTLTMTGGEVGKMTIRASDLSAYASNGATVHISGGTVNKLTSRSGDKAKLTVSGSAAIGAEGSSGNGLQYSGFQSVTIADTPTVRFEPVSGAAAGDTVASAAALTNLSLCGSEADKFELELDGSTVKLKAKPQHTHNWGAIWEKDDTGHWHECYAGDPCPITDHTQKDGYAVHAAGDEYKSDNDNHWKECVCGHRMEETGHTLQYTSDEWNHRQICAVCGDFDQDRGTEKPHDWESDTDTTCNTCGYTRTVTPSHTHVWDTGWTFNEDYHWHRCIAEGCGITDYTENVIAMAARLMPHTKTWVNTDAAQHWQTCATCGWTGTKADHDYDNDQDAECNTCGYTRTITPPTPPDSGSTEGKVEVGEGAPPVTVGTDTLNTLKDLAGTPEADETITVKLTVEKKAESDAEGAAEIKGAATGKTVEFLDLSLIKTVTGGTKPGDSPIKDTQDKVLEIVVSYDLSGKKDVTVYRYHGGTVQELIQDGTKADGSFQLGANSITIYTTKFSTYAIGYTPDSGGNQPQPPSGGGDFSGWGSDFSGSYIPPAYPVELPASVSGGKVTVSHKSAPSGTRVTLTLAPDEGYEIGGVAVTDQNGRTVAVTDRGNGTYTFTMPSGRVTVKAEFIKSKGSYANCPRDDSCPIRRFTDINPAAWYHDGVHYCVENGLMSGYGGGLFGADDNISRAEFVQILYNKEGRPAAGGGNGFTDVPSGAWYANAVTWAAARGIAGGYGGGCFGPGDSITCEQLAVMLWRYAGSPAATGTDLYFPGADKAGGYALAALRWAAEQGIIGGDGGILNPAGQATRAEAAQMLKNFMEKR